MRGDLIIKNIQYSPKVWKVAVLISFVMLSACSPVKFVPEGNYLLNKVEVEIDNPDISRDEAKVHVRQKENYKILGFAKFHLWLYNLSSKKKSEGWLKKIGEPPEIFDPALVSASEDRLEQYLANKGYFRAKAESEVTFKEKKQKANVKYEISTGDQYKIREVNYHIGDSALKMLFNADSANTFIKPGTPFDFNLLEEQRNKIVNLFRNEGYYFISNDEVSYLADSSKYDREIILDLFVGMTPSAKKTERFIPYYLDQFYISVLPGSVPISAEQTGNWNYADTLHWDNHTLY